LVTTQQKVARATATAGRIRVALTFLPVRVHLSMVAIDTFFMTLQASYKLNVKFDVKVGYW
jgi:hypothetical protein